MSELLYSFCAAWLSSDPSTNDEILRTCSPIFFVDGQEIPFAELMRKIAKVPSLHDAALFERNSALGEDSIQYQQLRGYELATQLIDNQSSLQRKADRPLRIGIVGAGFAGLTAALTFLKQSDASVTLFEAHHQYLPRFAGAYGRMVHPYHHLRVPKDEAILDDSDKTTERYTWYSPLRGKAAFETGGVDGILTWHPGPIENVVSEVKATVDREFAAYVDENRLVLRLGTKAIDIPAETVPGGPVRIKWRDTRVVPLRLQYTSLAATAGDGTDQFDIVILALGGERDVQTLSGQSNHEYWNPLRVENMSPSSRRFEAAIIGSGNTAASEVFNLLLTRRDFVGLLQQIQQWASQNHKSLTQALSLIPSSLDDLSSKLTDEEWDSLADAVSSELVGTGKLYSDHMIRITLYTRTSTPLFEKMNTLNRFLVLLLARLGYVRIVNLYDLYYGPAHPESEDYRISIGKSGVRRLFFRGAEILPPRSTNWTYVFMCTGPQRFYHEAFGVNAVRLGHRFASHYRYGKTQDGKVAMPLTDMLERKHSFLKRPKKQGSTTTA